METDLLLKDEHMPPTPEVLQAALGEAFPVFNRLMAHLGDPSLALAPEWRYYKDGHAWLCKVTHKKKTIFWLSVWDQHFKTAFYFTEKTGQGIAGLDIAAGIKEDFSKAPAVGKLIPLVFVMRTENQIPDLLKVVEYKKGLK